MIALVADPWDTPEQGDLEAFEVLLARLEVTAAAALDRFEAGMALRGRWIAAEGDAGRSLTLEEVVAHQETALRRAELCALLGRVAEPDE